MFSSSTITPDKQLKPIEKKFYKKLSFCRFQARLIFKILMVVGFAIQSAKFLEMYLAYPSVVELDVSQPHEVDFPAFTVCNLNEIRVGPYCRKYPSKCATINDYPRHCQLYPEYCRLVGQKNIPLPIHPVSEYNLDREERRQFGHQFRGLIRSCVIETDGAEENCTSRALLIQSLSHSHTTPFNCFTMYSLDGHPNTKPKVVPVSTVIRLILNLEVEEYHPEHLSRGAQISIHSPYHIPSPMSNGQILDMGAIYRFYMSMTRLQLLKAPYKSRCQDYMEEWRKNGGKGPITQKMCKEKCKLDRSLELYGCVDARVDYPHNETICEKVIPRFHQEAMPVCAKKCGMPCKFDNYEFQVQQSFSEGFRKDCITAHDLACSTLVQIFLENMEISTFTYSPRLEPVGILSWIGGYVGLWLGISLIQVYDFLEARIFNGISYLQKRHARDKKRKHRRKLGFEGYQTKLYRKH